MSKTIGKCACGAVQFSVETEGAEISAAMCHCKTCRSWGGGLPLTVFIGEVDLQISDTLKWWKSSPWGERGFCGECGASLFWRAPDSPIRTVSVGALDDSVKLKIGGHIFVDHGGNFYDLSDGTPESSGAQYAAKMMTQLSGQYGDEFLSGAIAQMRAHSGDAFADEVENLLAKN